MDRRVLLQALEDAKAYRRNRAFINSHMASCFGGIAMGSQIIILALFIDGKILIGFLALFISLMLGLWAIVRGKRYMNEPSYDYQYMQATIDLTTFEDSCVKGELP